MTRIAVINDDQIFLDMMTAVLEERGWAADRYREGDAAFQGIRTDPPDLVILDIRMESPDAGWRVLELLM
jgi:DNA-binding response OmpR family regulator